MKKDQLEQYNARMQWHPMTHPNAMEANPPIIIEKGEGVWITDHNGNRMVDGTGGLWNVNVGHGRAEVKQAIVEQLDEIAYYSLFKGTTHPKAISLSHKLVQMTGEENMRRVMFSSGGSDAIETALRLARQYWKVEGQHDRTKFISLKKGYHGTHFGGASINGNTVFRRNYEPLLPGCFHIETPFTYRNPFTEDPEKLAEICATLLEREIQFQGPDTVAAFIAEPVQGAGGVIVPPPNYWPLVREVCDRYGVLLIADEVVAGFGRTGSMFGSRGWGVKPDMMCFAKGITSGYIPMGATMVNERIEAAFKNNQGGFAAIMHGYTYTGHPVACAAALAVLDIVEREDLPANAATQGRYFMERLKPFEERFKHVGEVRGKGLMLALDLVADKKTKQPADLAMSEQVAALARSRGAMIRASGNNLILSPPLTIGPEELDVIVEALEYGLAGVQD